ncbi:hypothetical protein N7449_006635 [Penicillium cf. viridicatum]|uniref:Uncharacterized protein n=1 Tax=Penicillium cf. viridicatum TaxID=2972119 RepID=A0A9W9JKV0_9EURO|nr:hypothetical protein N7449_006635 [Penicillium cf. viridicatum]
MQREEYPSQEAGEGVETTEAVRAAEKAAVEEKQKCEDRAAVTRGLTDLPTMKQLSTSGWEAKSKRKKYLVI